jgi:hypothetical protein
MSRVSEPGVPSRLGDAPVRKGADSGYWTVILGGEEITLILYNSVQGQRPEAVAVVSEPYLSASLPRMAQTVYIMALTIQAQCKVADDLQDTLQCPVRLVKLSTL